MRLQEVFERSSLIRKQWMHKISQADVMQTNIVQLDRDARANCLRGDNLELEGGEAAVWILACQCGFGAPG